MREIRYFGLGLTDLIDIELRGVGISPRRVDKKNLCNKHKILGFIESNKFKIKSKFNRKKKNILILGSRRLVEPLAKYIKRNIYCGVIRGGEYVGRSIFLSCVDDYLSFNDYNGFRINNCVSKFRNSLMRDFDELGLDKYPRNFLISRFTDLVHYIEIMKSLKSKIDMVVTYNDILSFEKTIIKTSNKLGIPTLTILHGFGNYGLRKKERCFIPFNASKMAVLNNSQKEVIINEGVSEDKINVTGLPALDKYFNGTSAKSVRKELKIPKMKKIVVYTAEVPHAERNVLAPPTTKELLVKRYEELFSVLKEFPELHLIIKLHPNISLDDNLMSSILEEASGKSNYYGYTVTRDTDAFRILNDAFIVITRRSTMGLESFFLKKPLIVFDTYTQERDLMGYTKNGTALWAKKEGQLKDKIKQLMDEKERMKLVSKMENYVDKYYPVKGEASKRLASLIKKTMD